MNPTLRDFETWLSNEPLERTFNYMDQLNCPFASFMKEYYNIPVCVGGHTFLTQDSEEYMRRKDSNGCLDFNDNENHKIPQWFQRVLSRCDWANHMSIQELLGALPNS